MCYSLLQGKSLRARVIKVFTKPCLHFINSMEAMIAKKSKYKSVVIKKKRYYFYKITWKDITGDAGHSAAHEFAGMMPAMMVTHAYVFNRDKDNVRTFASYEINDELFSDRNVFPVGCIVKMERILL